MIVGRIFDSAYQHFGNKNVFFDIESIPAGTNFVDYIVQRISECDAVLALIGPNWLLEDRLSIKEDTVGLELETASNLGIQVIPLLLVVAPMSEALELPETLSWLPSTNAVSIDVGHDYQAHVKWAFREVA